MTQLDYWMPEFEVSAQYRIRISAPPEVIYRTLLSARFARHPVIRGLMFARGLPARLTNPAAAWHQLRSPPRPAGDLTALLDSGFILLADVLPEELVLGLTGRFWTRSGGRVSSSKATFKGPLPANQAQAAWNFRLEPRPDGDTSLSTETRVRCADPGARRSFRRYWTLIGAASGMMRRVMLKQIKREAEAAAPCLEVAE